MENELYKKMYDDVLSGEFKPVNFSIYNFIEEDGWVKELNSEYDDVYGIEDFEYVTINLTNEEKSLLLNNDGQVMSKYRGFKSFVELIKQKDLNVPKMGVFIMKKFKTVVAVRLK